MFGSTWRVGTGGGGRHGALAVALVASLWPLAGGGAGRPSAAAMVAPPAAAVATPVAVNQLGGTPGYGGQGAVTFTYSSHYYSPGATVTASLRVTSAECRILGCFLGANWGNLGVPAGRCRPSAMRCSWRLPAATPLYQWQGGRLPITTTLGMQESDDFFAVIVPGQPVLETRVADVAGSPYPNVKVSLGGPVSAALTTDGNGFAVALVPAGRYRVRLNVGTAATRWFRGMDQTLNVRGIAHAQITAYNHLRISLGRSSVLANGQQAITVTVQGSNPFGQAIGSMGVQTAVSGPGAVLCAVPPSAPGFLEPQDVSSGTPLYLPVNQTADGNGNVSYQVFFGSEPGLWRIAVRDSILTPGDPWLRRQTTVATVRLRPARWDTFLPARLRVTLYTAGGRGAPATLSLPQLLWQALQGHTVPGAVTGSNGLTLAPLNTGDPLGSQKAVLRWLETFVPLDGLEIGPVYAGGSSNWGVAIFVHHRYGARGTTRILDVNTLTALMNAATPRALPGLPTLSAGAARTRSTVEQGYAEPTPEAGFTYYGLPYLPGSDALMTSYDANCLQRAP